MLSAAVLSAAGALSAGVLSADSAGAASSEETVESPAAARMASCTSLSAMGAGSEAAAAVDSGLVSLSVRPVRYQLPFWRRNR